MERFESIAQMLGPVGTVADIGADHAQLLLYLLDRELCIQGIATELHDGPFKRLSQAIAACAHRERVTLRKGNGLQVLLPGEVDNVVIAGMGGETIAAILAYDLNLAGSFKNFILQPMSRLGVLRRFLSLQGWPIIQEKIVKKRYHYYNIIRAKPGNIPYELSLLEQEIGSEILENSCLETKDYLVYKLEQYKKIHESLKGANSSSGYERFFYYKTLIGLLEGKLYASS